MKHQKTTLKNGLRVITSPMPSFESSTVMVMVGAGSRYEVRQSNGISHFLEHMAFKGTRNRPSALDISTLIDGIGGEFNAFTSKEITGYYIKSQAAHAELCIDVLSDMLANSLFKEEEIDKERGVILEEINLYEDTPARKIGDVYERLLFGDTPMGWDIAGEKDVIRKITREDFVKYLSSLYSPKNMTLVVAGGIDSSKIVKLAEKYFGNMKSFDTMRYIKARVNQKKPRVLVKQKNTEQVHVALGVTTVPIDHPDHYVLNILAAILGGGMSSRLFHEVRERRGLAYYVRSSSDHYQDAGTLASTAGLDPKRVTDGISVMVEEYAKIRESAFAPTDAELKKAKEFVKGHLVLELEDSRAVSGFYGQQEMLERKIKDPDDVLAKLNKVSKEDVVSAAKKYLKDSTLNLAVIGNFKSEKEFEKLLKF